MKKLTENLIQQRLKTCTTDLDKVLQINITGRELQDVSLLRKMTGVEILSLSVNQISSLIDFQYCKNLKELYLRNNNITDLKQVYYLSNLPKLKFLMLSQNPCATDPLYRPTVIRNLQSLIELDGILITPEERQKAHKTGLALNSEPFRSPENYDYEDTQNRRPIQLPQELENETEKIEANTTVEPTFHDTNSLYSKESSECVKQVELSEVTLKPLNLCDMCREKSAKLTVKKELKEPKYYGNIEKPSKQLLCKFCKAHGADSVLSARIFPKNSNILSAILNLIKELDYTSLQIVQAEIISLLNTFEVEFVCHAQ